LGGAPSSFTRDNLITPAVGFSHQYRLHDAVGLDGLRQFFQLRLVETRSRLHVIWFDEVYVNFS
jgi:hypothetical protein